LDFRPATWFLKWLNVDVIGCSAAVFQRDLTASTFMSGMIRTLSTSKRQIEIAK
jgi:hypothetical protein